MDALSAILESTKLKGVVYNKLVNCAPWGLDVSQDMYSQYWRLIKGNCVIGLPGGQTIEMKEGDLVFIPHGSSHWIADRSTSRRVSAGEYTKARQAGIPIFCGEGEQTTIIGGHFQFDNQQIHPFLKDLPRIIQITHFETENQLLLQHFAQLMLSELNNEKPGGKIMLRSLAEILFVNIIRAYLEQNVPQAGFLASLNDKRISKALKLMQDSPGNDWTIESLATNVGMSRSVFFNLFKKLVGETPLAYLTNWRISKAKELLMISSSNINEVALTVGYQSEAAFNRIFKAKTGKTPAVYRKSEFD